MQQGSGCVGVVLDRGLSGYLCTVKRRKCREEKGGGFQKGKRGEEGFFSSSEHSGPGTLASQHTTTGRLGKT